MKVRRSCDLNHKALLVALRRNIVSKVTQVLKQALRIPGATIPSRTGALNRKEGVEDNQQCHTIPCIPKSRLSRGPELNTHTPLDEVKTPTSTA